MNDLTVFGLVAASLMLLFYALEKYNNLFVLAFSISCMLGSIYCLVQGAWPFGIVEFVWAGVAYYRWRNKQL
jgi:hypothetical protein